MQEQTHSDMFPCARNSVLFSKFQSKVLAKLKILETPDWVVTDSPITKHLITNYDVNHLFSHDIVSIIYSYVMPPKLSVGDNGRIKSKSSHMQLLILR